MPPDPSQPNLTGPTGCNHKLLLTIWLQPRATLRYILAYCPTRNVRLFLVLGGITRALDRFDPSHMPSPGAVMVAVLLSSAFGWLFYYCYAYGLSLTGRLLHGVADLDSCETVVAWALVPSIAAIPLLVILLSIPGNAALQQQLASLHLSLEFLRPAVLGSQLVLAAWSVCILLRGIMLVQRFRLGKAVLNMLLPGALLLAAIASFAGLYQLFMTLS